MPFLRHCAAYGCLAFDKTATRFTSLGSRVLYMSAAEPFRLSNGQKPQVTGRLRAELRVLRPQRRTMLSPRGADVPHDPANAARRSMAGAPVTGCSHIYQDTPLAPIHCAVHSRRKTCSSTCVLNTRERQRQRKCLGQVGTCSCSTL